MEAYLQPSLLWLARLTYVDMLISITIANYEVLVPTSAGLKKISGPTYLLGESTYTHKFKWIQPDQHDSQVVSYLACQPLSLS